MRAFEPEFAGKMNFYLSAVNDLLRDPDDQPSIGIILCRTRDRFIAEYALRDIHKPIGISEYRLQERRCVAREIPQSHRASIKQLQGVGRTEDECAAIDAPSYSSRVAEEALAVPGLVERHQLLRRETTATEIDKPAKSVDKMATTRDRAYSGKLHGRCWPS